MKFALFYMIIKFILNNKDIPSKKKIIIYNKYFIY